MTEYERASLRLEAWKAARGWATTIRPPKKDTEGKIIDIGEIKEWDWTTRMKYADELFEWMVKHGNPQPAGDDSETKQHQNENVTGKET